MENLQTQTPEPTTAPTAQQPKKSRGVALNLTVCLVVVVAIVTGVYLWQHQKVNDLNTKNESLATQLAAAKAQVKVTQNFTSSTNDEQVSYKATVGKFTLTLPDTYAIVRENDGGAEGGPFTSLEIGSKTSINAVVDYSQTAQPSIVARAFHGSETFRSLVDADVKDMGNPTKTTVKVDGIDAESYTYGGFGAPQSVYFTKNGIYYKFHTEEMDSSAGKLDSIIAGFKFN
jgi:cytoskeletal protein RodZ